MSVADTFFEDDLADAGAGMDRERHRAGVVHLQHLLSVFDTGLHEVGGHVHHQADTSEAAPALYPAADVVGQRDALAGDAVYGLAGQQEEVIRHFDHVGDLAVVGVIRNVEDVVDGAEDTKLISEVQIDRGWADAGRVERIDPDLARFNALEELGPGEHAHRWLIPFP